MIGFFFSAVFTAIDRLASKPFFAGGQAATSATVQYFSFVTLTTTGYGDYTALGEGGRSMAVLEALLGQIFLVTLVARLVALFGMARPAGRPGRRARSPASAPRWRRPPERDRTGLVPGPATGPSSGSASARAARRRAR